MLTKKLTEKQLLKKLKKLHNKHKSKRRMVAWTVDHADGKIKDFTETTQFHQYIQETWKTKNTLILFLHCLLLLSF